MFQYATYFLYVLVSWDVWTAFAQDQNNAPHHSAVYNPQSGLDQIGIHQQQWFSYNSLRQALTDEKINNLEMRLLALLKQLESQLQTLRNLQELEKERIKASKRIIKPFFEKIGSRYFYIEKQNKVNWYLAFDKCRRMGGHLLNVKNETNFDEIFSKVPPGNYWIDSASLDKKDGYFMSTLTGRSARYLKWKGTRNTSFVNCAMIKSKEMYSVNCQNANFFICQAEPWY